MDVTPLIADLGDRWFCSECKQQLVGLPLEVDEPNTCKFAVLTHKDDGYCGECVCADVQPEYPAMHCPSCMKRMLRYRCISERRYIGGCKSMQTCLHKATVSNEDR